MKRNIQTFSPKFSVFKDFPIPRTENDYKLQTLLIYIHDRLKDTIKSLKENKGESIFDKDTEALVINFDKELCNTIEEYVPTYETVLSQREKIIYAINPTVLQIKIFAETIPFSTFNNRIVEECEKFFPPTRKWIPDLVALSLLNYWVKDFEKKTFTYNFIYKLNLQEILDLYNKASIDYKSVDLNMSNTTKEMYTFTELIINKISEMKYKTIFIKKPNKKPRRTK